MSKKDFLYADIIGQTKFIIERLRVFSRLFLIFYAYVLYTMIQWVMGMDDLSNAQAALASTIAAIAAPLTKFYIDSGKNLYETYDEMQYKYSFVKVMDRIGFIIDRWRIFPTLFVGYYAFSLYSCILWAMGLGDDLTTQQASFVSLYAGAGSAVIGFFINVGDVSLKLEKEYVERKTANKLSDDEN